MTAAEKLRQEMAANAPFTKEEFIDHISSRIKVFGRASFICDRHIGKTEFSGLCTLKIVHEQLAVDYARSEGFHVSYSYNSYGVRHIIFTL